MLERIFLIILLQWDSLPLIAADGQGNVSTLDKRAISVTSSPPNQTFIPLDAGFEEDDGILTENGATATQGSSADVEIYGEWADNGEILQAYDTNGKHSVFIVKPYDEAADKVKTVSAQTKSLVNKLEEPEKVFTRVGCFSDEPAHIMTSLEMKDPLLMDNYKTRQDPLAKCAEVAFKKDYSLFAMQEGGECYAGYVGKTPYDMYGNSFKCREDGLGGPFSMEVYKFENTPKESSWDELKKLLNQKSTENSEAAKKPSNPLAGFFKFGSRPFKRRQRPFKRYRHREAESRQFNTDMHLASSVSIPSDVSCYNPSQVCSSKVNLAVVMDASSINDKNAAGHFDAMAEFARRVASSFTMSETESRLGLILFSNDAHVVLDFRAVNQPEALIAARNYVAVNPTTKQSMGGAALQLAYRALFGPLKREGSLSLMLFLTDRPLVGDVAGPAQMLRNLNVKIVAVNVGSNPDHTDLKKIVSAPATDNLFQARFREMEEVLPKVQRSLCLGGTLTKTRRNRTCPPSSMGKAAQKSAEPEASPRMRPRRRKQKLVQSNMPEALKNIEVIIDEKDVPCDGPLLATPCKRNIDDKEFHNKEAHSKLKLAEDGNMGLDELLDWKKDVKGILDDHSSTVSKEDPLKRKDEVLSKKGNERHVGEDQSASSNNDLHADKKLARSLSEPESNITIRNFSSDDLQHASAIEERESNRAKDKVHAHKSELDTNGKTFKKMYIDDDKEANGNSKENLGAVLSHSRGSDNRKPKGLLNDDVFLEASHIWPLDSASTEGLVIDMVTGRPGLMHKARIIKSAIVGHSLSTDAPGSFAILGNFNGTCYSDPSLCILGGLTVFFFLELPYPPKNLPGKMFVISSGAQSPNGRGFAVFYENQRLYFMVSTKSSICVANTTAVPWRQWMSYAIVWSKNESMTLFVNGEPYNDGHCVEIEDRRADFNMLFVGRPNNVRSSKYDLNMRIAHIGLWDKPLKESDIWHIHKEVISMNADKLNFVEETARKRTHGPDSYRVFEGLVSK